MYHCAELYLPRKKKVYETFHSNTYRIFDERIPDKLEPDKVYKNHSYATRDPKEYELLKTHNFPQTSCAKFIRTNVRFLNAPITHMETDITKCKWWPESVDHDLRVKAPYTIDTTQRKDFQAIPQKLPAVRRVTNNRMAASGILPTLHPLNNPTVLLESVSTFHQDDGRKLQDQPCQGKHHGAFEWREVNPRGARTFLSNGGSRPAAEDGGNAVTSPQLSSLYTQHTGKSGGASSS